MQYDYELIIIGGGSGGLSAAELAGQLGLTRVALVEAQKKLGGECLHTGCVPSKALLHAAKYKDVDAWQHIAKSIEEIEKRSDNDEHFKAQGLSVFHSFAQFTDPHTIKLDDGATLTSKYFLLSTGSYPALPKIDGIDSVAIHTNETIFGLGKTPGSLAIVGGGPIGSELATAFAMLGTKVTLLQSADRLLPREEPIASNAVLMQLQNLDVSVHLNTKVNKITEDENKKTISLTVGEHSHRAEAEHVLVAAGRMPNIFSLELEQAGITYDQRGIGINRFFQTSAEHIFAVGDCTTSPKFTHLAAHQAGIALRNMLTPFYKKSGSYLDVVPAITYTQPEIGRIGMTEAEAIAAGKKIQVFELDLKEIDRAISDNEPEGFIKVLVGWRGRLVGATVVGSNASELLGPLAHIYYHKQSLSSLAKTVFPYPTLSTGLNLLASEYLTHKTAGNALFKKFTQKWRNPS